MLTKIVIGLAITIVLIAAFFGFKHAQTDSRAQTLADGSKLSLAGVTYGSKHTMPYGPSLANYLYPILSPSLRTKWGCKTLQFNSANSNAIAVWFWDKRTNQISPTGRWTSYWVTTVDENGVESEWLGNANANAVWRGSNVLQGWELKQFPRNNPDFTVRVYGFASGQKKVCAEFKVSNPARRAFAKVHRLTLPITIATNGLEISLTSFETVLTNYTTTNGISEKKEFIEAMFNIKEQKRPCEDWGIGPVTATSIGDSRQAFGNGDGRSGLGIPVNLAGVLWPQQFNWKLNVQLLQATNSPEAKNWNVKEIIIPEIGKRANLNFKTNFYGSEFEVCELSGRNRSQRAANLSFLVLHLRNPLPMGDVRFQLLEIKDDQGRIVEKRLGSSVPSTGDRGATIRQLDSYYILSVADDAKSIDLTLACTKILSVEFEAGSASLRISTNQAIAVK